MMPDRIRPKEMKRGSELREAFLTGVRKLADAVSVTLGPGGRNVAIDKLGEVQITKDGVTVAKSITKLEDPYEDMGAQLVKSVASKTGDSAGDGTTTATVLAESMLTAGMYYTTPINNEKINVTRLREGMLDALEFIKSYVQGQSRPCDTVDMAKQVAIISANGDEKIGDLIHTAFEKQGQDTVVTIEATKNPESTVEIVQGLRYDAGYIHPAFVTNGKNMKIELDNPYILIIDHKLQGIREIANLLNEVVPTGRPLLIMANKFDPDAIEALAVNHLNKTIKLGVTEFPMNFEADTQYLAQDIAILTGGTVVSHHTGIDIDKVTLAHLGQAKRVVVAHHHTTIIEGAGAETDIQMRIDQLKDARDKLENDILKKQLLQRIAFLRGGVTTIKVGGATEEEASERKDRLDDAVAAVYAAYKKGVVPGGGVTLLRAKKALQKHMSNVDEENVGSVMEDAFLVGQSIVEESLDSPINKILENSDTFSSALIEKLLKSKKDIGYNARTKEVVNMLQAGVIDPTEVVLSSLSNAVSIVSLLLTTEVAIIDKPKDQREERE